jgi:hypothetical protein
LTTTSTGFLPFRMTSNEYIGVPLIAIPPPI